VRRNENGRIAFHLAFHRILFAGQRRIAVSYTHLDVYKRQLLDHVANDDLVAWGWNPGDGRTLPPLTRPETVAQMKIWINGGAACPE